MERPGKIANPKGTVQRHREAQIRNPCQAVLPEKAIGSVYLIDTRA